MLEWDEEVGVFASGAASAERKPVTARQAQGYVAAKAHWEMIGKVQRELVRPGRKRSISSSLRHVV